MRTLTRRGWFRRIGGVALGLALARELPGLAPKPAGLLFHKDAFAMAMAPLGDPDWYDAYVAVLVDNEIEHRWAFVRPEWSCRVEG